MYSRNSNNHLQIELADLSKTKAVRVVAVDNGVFSFEDKVMGEWPLAVVTNPKPAYELTEADPLRLMQTSTRNHQKKKKIVHEPFAYLLALFFRHPSLNLAQQAHTFGEGLHRRGACVP